MQRNVLKLSSQQSGTILIYQGYSQKWLHSTETRQTDLLLHRHHAQTGKSLSYQSLTCAHIICGLYLTRQPPAQKLLLFARMSVPANGTGQQCHKTILVKFDARTRPRLAWDRDVVKRFSSYLSLLVPEHGIRPRLRNTIIARVDVRSVQARHATTMLKSILGFSRHISLERL